MVMDEDTTAEKCSGVGPMFKFFLYLGYNGWSNF